MHVYSYEHTHDIGTMRARAQQYKAGTPPVRKVPLWQPKESQARTGGNPAWGGAGGAGRERARGGQCPLQ